MPRGRSPDRRERSGKIDVGLLRRQTPRAAARWPNASRDRLRPDALTVSEGRIWPNVHETRRRIGGMHGHQHPREFGPLGQGLSPSLFGWRQRVGLETVGAYLVKRCLRSWPHRLNELKRHIEVEVRGRDKVAESKRIGLAADRLS